MSGGRPQDEDAAEASSSQQHDTATSAPGNRRRPHYMTVGDGATSASAAALMATLEHDSGYGGSLVDGQDSGSSKWLSRMSEDRYTPADTPGTDDPELEKRVLASHVHQLYYNQNRAALGRQITRTIETLRALQQMNASWPAQYPAVREQSLADQHRPKMPTKQSTVHGGDAEVLHAHAERPQPPRRAATNTTDSAEGSSSSAPPQRQEPERLITRQAAQDFSVLKLNMNVQGLTQAEIAHSMKKESIASLLDGKINQSIRHLLLLRDRIEDISSKVLVTGDLNAGKSTFCNALLRRKILPEDQQPCTSIFCEVLDAKENGGLEEAHAIPHKVTYDRNNESTYDVYQLHELEKIVVDNERYAACKIYIKDSRKIDESLLNNGVVDIALIDAPGLNSDSLQTTAVFARQEEIDVVVFVVSAANHFTQSAKEFIFNAAQEKAYIFIVVNGFDNIRDQERCQRKVLEQVATLSPRTFKESSELVHFVSSNAIPVATTGSHGGRPSLGSSASGSGSGSSGKPPGGDRGGGGHDDDDESKGKHGSPGLSPKGKGKDKEKIQDFEELEGSLRRFVLEKRARSKLAPAKTYLLNLLTDLNLLAEVNRDISQAELTHVVQELDEIEPAYEKSKKARSEVSDGVETTIEDTCTVIYNDSRTIVDNAVAQVGVQDLGVPYDGLLSAFQFAEDLKVAMLDQISEAIGLCEKQAKTKTIASVNTIKSMGILHVGNQFEDLNFNSEKMFRGKRDVLSREVDFDIEIADFFDLSGLWERQEKVAGTGMALTVASMVGGRLIGGSGGAFGWVDGTISTMRVMGPQNLRRMILPGLVIGVLLTATYLLHSIPHTLPTRLSRRIAATLQANDYTHRNASRIAHEVRKILRFPAESLRSSLAASVRELGERREDKRKVQRESEVARKYFGNLVRETADGKARVEDVDLEGAAAPAGAGAYEPRLGDQV